MFRNAGRERRLLVSFRRWSATFVFRNKKRHKSPINLNVLLNLQIINAIWLNANPVTRFVALKNRLDRLGIRPVFPGIGPVKTVLMTVTA